MPLCHKGRYLLVFLVHHNLGMSQVFAGKLLVQSAGVYHHTHIGLVDIGQTLKPPGLRCTAKNGLAVGQIAIAHQHRLASGIGDGDAPDGQVEHLRVGKHISRQRRPRGFDKRYAYSHSGSNLLRNLDAKAPVGPVGFTKRQRPIVARRAKAYDATFFNLCNLPVERNIGIKRQDKN